MLLKKGSKGNEVKILQRFLNILDDGIFGNDTKNAVIEWQKKHKLKPDGIVGDITWNAMMLATTDAGEHDKKDIVIHQYYLPKNEYISGKIKPEWIFLHHTAGWNNPYNQINDWANDKRGPIATEFVIGGQSIRNNDLTYDGEIVEAFPEGNWGWHLGTGSSYMHTNSIGIELCNFGWIKDGKTWAGHVVHPDQIVTLKKSFRGYTRWHKYSDNQIESLRDLLLWIGNYFSIDIRKGLPEAIKSVGVLAFEFNRNVLHGDIPGIWSHSNVRTDKFDIFPQEEMMDMLISL